MCAAALSAHPHIGCGTTYGLRCPLVASFARGGSAAAGTEAGHPVPLAWLLCLLCDGVGTRLPTSLRSALGEQVLAEWTAMRQKYVEELRSIHDTCCELRSTDAFLSLIARLVHLTQATIAQHAMTHTPRPHEEGAWQAPEYVYSQDTLAAVAAFACLVATDALVAAAQSEDALLRFSVSSAAGKVGVPVSFVDVLVDESPETEPHPMYQRNLDSPANVSARTACLGLVQTVVDVMAWRAFAASLMAVELDSVEPLVSPTVDAGTSLVVPDWASRIISLLCDCFGSWQTSALGVWLTILDALRAVCEGPRVFTIRREPPRSEVRHRPALAPGPHATLHRALAFWTFSNLIHRSLGEPMLSEQRMKAVARACGQLALQRLWSQDATEATAAAVFLPVVLRHVILSMHTVATVLFDNAETRVVTTLFPDPEHVMHMPLSLPAHPVSKVLRKLSTALEAWIDRAAQITSADAGDFRELCEATARLCKLFA